MSGFPVGVLTGGGGGGGRGVGTMNRRPGGVKITPKNPSLSCAPRAPRGPPRGDFGALPPGALSKSGVRTCSGDSPSENNKSDNGKQIKYHKYLKS